jgi:hypothetical protein
VVIEIGEMTKKHDNHKKNGKEDEKHTDSVVEDCVIAQSHR